MKFRRKPKRTLCPICGNSLTDRDGRKVCETCWIELIGSSVKPLNKTGKIHTLPSRPEERRI